MVPAPLRTCIGCRARDEKDLLLRVMAHDGVVEIDIRQVLPGRGAYLHRRRACVEAAFARGAVARVLRTGLDEHGAATLRADIEGELDR